MTKIICITCDVCDADITSSSRVEVSWISTLSPTLHSILYFCGYEHMYQYLDERKPQNNKGYS